MKKLLLAATMVALLTGCASVPMGDPARDTQLKSFQAVPGQVAVYVFRNESMGGAVKMDVIVNGRNIGETAANTFLFAEAPPGKVTVASKAENTDTVEFEAKAGDIVYVWQEVKMGLMFARTKLHVVPAEQGQKGVRETKLAVSK
jgi:hypothetical protein